MRLAGGGTRCDCEMDLDEFKLQVNSYVLEDYGVLDSAYRMMQTIYRTHPFPIVRAKELMAWHTDGYTKLNSTSMV